MVLLELQEFNIKREIYYRQPAQKFYLVSSIKKRWIFQRNPSVISKSILSLPFPLSLQLPFCLASQFKLLVPRTFLHPFLYVFAAIFCNNSCNLIKQFRGRTFKHLAYLSSSEKVLFTVGCLFCLPVQLIIIIFNLTVISVFDCFV